MTSLHGLEYYLHDNGIQEYRILEATHEAVDEWMEMAIANARDVPASGLIRYLIVLPAGELIPLMHTFTRIQESLKARPQRPSTRVAILHAPDFLVSVLEAFIRMLRSGDKDVVRFFLHDQREDAIRWLLDK
jgi:hypothetical protein